MILIGAGLPPVPTRWVSRAARATVAATVEARYEAKTHYGSRGDQYEAIVRLGLLTGRLLANS